MAIASPNAKQFEWWSETNLKEKLAIENVNILKVDADNDNGNVNNELFLYVYGICLFLYRSPKVASLI